MLRNTNRIGRWIVIALAIGLLCSAEAPAKKPPPPPPGDPALYTLVDLPGLPGGPGGGFQSDPVAVSEPDQQTGQFFVVGNSFVGSGWRPALWSVSGDGSFTVTDLGLPPGATEAGATDVNDVGVVTINTWQTDEPLDPAFVLAPGMPLEPLAMLDGVSATASAVNIHGEIAGHIIFDDGVTREGFGALWVLGEPIGLGDFWPSDVSDSGVMAGERDGQPAIAWLNIAGDVQVQQLDMLPGFEFGTATAISENGTWVAGYVRGGLWEAFVWSADTGMIGLGRFGGGASIAHDVNNAGHVVGWSDTGGGRYSQAAFLWKNGRLFDLNALADTGGQRHLSQARAINDRGHIVGLMRISRPVSESHSFLLIPNGE